jgi:hypothetical protein
MSHLPKPAVLPVAKAFQGNRDFQSAEHEAALRVVWARLGVGMERLFGWRGSKSREQGKTAIEQFELSLNGAKEALGSMVERCEDAEVKGKLAAALGRLVAADLGSQVAPWPKNVASVEVTKSELAKELTEERSAGTSRAHDETVGYIDIAAEVKVPEKLVLASQLPPMLVRDGQGFWRDPLKLIVSDQRRGESIFTYEPSLPTWYCHKREATIYVDVRVQTPPLGQLLREVKALQALCAKKARVVMVLPKIDIELEAMLANVGATATSTQWWNDLPQA